MKLSMVLSVAFATLTFANKEIHTFDSLGLTRRQGQQGGICHSIEGGGCRAYSTKGHCCCTDCSNVECNEVCTNIKPTEICATCCNRGGEAHDVCCPVGLHESPCDPCKSAGAGLVSPFLCYDTK
ncbi:hypothetical protein JI435_423420 [Parastagonospora nodorum SN15]|uniref:SnTox1 chitin binding-like domain-containing protein n=1 Tax=Phaeosphaeria nodorum (strain SN15 / ATCC MYA-4574 / FGSC 10173) TaxID=321614 RepID=A0A7U2IB18_PHANO|nr:hypothetical protein JI435_423420 [Parastagonospora nodorum SN15]